MPFRAIISEIEIDKILGERRDEIVLIKKEPIHVESFK